jgi:hypothetical protein
VSEREKRSEKRSKRFNVMDESFLCVQKGVHGRKHIEGNR